MPDAFNPPPRARFRETATWNRRIFLNLALWLILVLAFLGMMSLARGAQVQPPPKPKVEIVPNVRPVPERAGRVTDKANVLKADDRARIDKALEQYERETFHPIALLTIPALAGEPIESYSRRVASAWKLGQKGLDDGILLVIAMNDKIVRIELGRGMQKYISNDEAEEIIEEHIIPSFGRGDYARGIQAGIIELMRLGRRFVVKKEDVGRAKGK
ncbi:MAG TPA: TPM domain-containing protein [Verrucomicrobiae bacterium]|nr:TPM domain-containing protein [Verrucomicrobiae bacterium]